MLQHLNSVPISPKRVVILGANGFIGTALKKNLNQAFIPYLSLSKAELDLVKSDAIEKISSLLDHEDIMVILATSASSNAMNTSQLINNLKIIENICLALQKKPCKQVIYFSSDAIYPIFTEIISEDTPNSPSNLYGTMHLAREFALKQTLETLFIPYTIIRPTQIYGKTANHNAYGPCRMCRTAVRDQVIRLFGQGEELRDFVYIDDTIKLLILIMCFQSIGVINFATGDSISFKDLANKILEAAGFPLKIISEIRETAIWHRQFDTTAIKKSFPDFQFSNIFNNLKYMLSSNASLFNKDL